MLNLELIPSILSESKLFIEMVNKVQNVILNNGMKMPILGLGTWDNTKGDVAEAVKIAIDIGYRLFDCAHAYSNEHEIGASITQKIQEDVVKREDLFIVSKLWNTFHRPDLVRGACETTLKNLGLDYIDLYLIHWPMGFKEGDDLTPTDENGKTLYSDADYVDTWQEMENLVQDGLCKSIGVSNFNKRQIERILAIARIPPVVNQVECHPYLTQKKLMEYCKSKNILLMTYSPLGSPNRPGAKAGDPILLEDPKIAAIAEKYKVTPAQILIRYQVQRGNICIPQAVLKSWIQSNFDVFNFELSLEDMATIDGFNCNLRFATYIDEYGHPHHPFAKDEF